MPKKTVLGYQIETHGGPEVLQFGPIELPELGPTDVLVSHRALGINFIDIYFREGLYPMELPGGLGLEAAGVVEAVGSEVSYVSVGERVAYCMSPIGAYAEAHVVPQQLLIPIPSEIDDITAAAITLKGLTAAFLLTALRPLRRGDAIVVHAAAGGVGQLLCQWARDMNLIVIGAVGSADKVALATAAGCDHVVVTEGDWVAQVREHCKEGVQMVFDSVGADTFDSSLACLARRGWFVSYGNSSGPAPAVLPLTLMQKGSLVMTRPSLADFISDREEMLSLASELFDRVISGRLQVNVGLTLPLSEAAKAHQMLKERKTTGSTVLTVEEST
ncbi:MAG: quinone oxidoreductase [Cellvibrionaceae bacterium]|nr:quinone oxidoreductase [Cellvibrionaceae bacterium]|tara:strand:- start:10740 stop:11732 length:993 start_codon:yes stop_codon:yes gene_type:complete